MSEPRPPVAPVAFVSLALVVAAGIYLVSHLPGDAPLALPAAFVAISLALMLVNVVALTRIPNFEWSVFLRVAKWSLLWYLISAGLIEWILLRHGTSGWTLAVLTLSLVVYATHPPLLTGYKVARYRELAA
jgi:hypothetical protein